MKPDSLNLPTSIEATKKIMNMINSFLHRITGFPLSPSQHEFLRKEIHEYIQSFTDFAPKQDI